MDASKVENFLMVVCHDTITHPVAVLAWDFKATNVQQLFDVCSGTNIAGIAGSYALETGVWTAVNTLRPRQKGHHFADNIFKCIFLNENIWIWIKISMFVPKGPINNIPALV